MEITGKLLSKLPPVNGTSQKGEWTKQDIVIETAETYPKKICISFMKEVEKIQAVQIGSNLTVHINIESREYNGKYYTDVRCWKFDVKSKPEPQSYSSPNFVEPENLTASDGTNHDLESQPPF